MTPFAAVLGGGAGGLMGGLAAQILVTALNRLQPAAADWLKGNSGPPFFNLALFMGIFYGSISLGLALARNPRRPRAVLVGLAGPFLGIAGPLAILTHAAPWTSAPSDVPTNAWIYAVTAVYVLAVWGTIFALGWILAPGVAWKSAAGSLAGALGGYFALVAVLKLASGQGSLYKPMGFLPPPTVILDGILSGIGMGLGIALSARRNNEKTKPA